MMNHFRTSVARAALTTVVLSAVAAKADSAPRSIPNLQLWLTADADVYSDAGGPLLPGPLSLSD